MLQWLPNEIVIKHQLLNTALKALPNDSGYLFSLISHYTPHLSFPSLKVSADKL